MIQVTHHADLTSGLAGSFKISGTSGISVICFGTAFASANLITVWERFMSSMAVATADAFFYLAVTGMTLAKTTSSSESSSRPISNVGTSGSRFSARTPNYNHTKNDEQLGKGYPGGGGGGWFLRLGLLIRA